MNSPSPVVIPSHVAAGKPRRLLLSFAGSLGPATVVDLMGLYNVASRLRDIGLEFDVVWDGPFFDLSHLCLHSAQVRADRYAANIYVGGPLWEGCRPTLDLTGNVPRLAVGISKCATAPPEGLVDAWFLCDSAEITGFDLGFGDIGYPHYHLPDGARRAGFTLSLLNGGAEFGADIFSKPVGEGLRAAIAARPWLEVDLTLSAARPAPEAVELDVQLCDGLVTTSAHAALLALYHGIPVCAVDQVPGGGRMTRLLGQIGHPVLDGTVADGTRLAGAVASVFTPEARMEAATARDEIVSHARLALTQAVDFILQEVA